LKDPSPEEGRDMSHGENAGGLGGGCLMPLRFLRGHLCTS